MCKKRVVIMVAFVILLLAEQAMGQTIVLEKFQLGKSTYDEVKANLPKGVLLVHDEATPIKFYGGRTLSTSGSGYDVDGLRAVNFSFDKKQTLVAVSMMLEKRRFRDIKKILTSKYKPVSSRYPSTVLWFKANEGYIQLFIPSGKFLFTPGDDIFAVEYMTRAIARKQRHSTQYVQPRDRKIRKKPGREAPADRAKF